LGSNTLIALLDGDIIAYQAASVGTKEIDWGDGDGAVPTSDLPGALETAFKLVEDWTRLAGCKQPLVCFSSRVGANFRKMLDPTYKAGRGDKPVLYWDVVDAIEKRFDCQRIEGIEADDVMGILGTSNRLGDTVIVSLDKDLATIPARVFNPAKDRRPRPIATAAADYTWMTQTLTGDPSDGYKGCPKVGPINAAKILAESGVQLGAMWSAVVAAFAAKDLTEDDALLQARLARILRRADYDRAKGTIALWHLTTPEAFPLNRSWTASQRPSASEHSSGKPRRLSRPRRTPSVTA
jgi:5'-3' exonuclease